MKKNGLKNRKIYVDDVDFKKLMIIYSMALQKANVILEGLREKINNKKENESIKNISVRIKEPDSIIDKMMKKGYILTYKTLIEKINDIAGARIICNSEQEVYKIVKEIERLKEIKILNRKDYIKKPKKSGYSAYHIISEIPIYLENTKVWIKVEIQIRTIDMDLWANLEHDISYKKVKKFPVKYIENVAIVN